MTLVGDHEGSQEWVCPICGHVLLIETNPSHIEIAIEGDRTVSHSGGIGGLRVAGVKADTDG